MKTTKNVVLAVTLVMAVLNVYAADNGMPVAETGGMKTALPLDQATIDSINRDPLNAFSEYPGSDDELVKKSTGMKAAVEIDQATYDSINRDPCNAFSERTCEG